MTETFDFYGLIVTLTCDDEAVVREVTRDFAWFAVPGNRAKEFARVHMNVEVRVQEPDYSGLPAVPSSVTTPRNISFRDGSVSYVDYFGRGLAIVDAKAGSCKVQGTDFDLLREICYLFLLSTVGQHLDSTGLHRIHAMGMNYKGNGVLLLLPSGGGKSTMTMELLRHPDFTLLSEDTPLIDRKGTMHPFPLRLGIRDAEKSDVPEEMRRTLNRMEFDPKTFVDVAFYEDRISAPVAPRILLVGRRNLGTPSTITPMGQRRALGALVKYLVVGLGVYQGLEFLLERGIGDMMGQTGVVRSRLRNSVALLRKVPAYEFVLGRDTAKNSRTLIDFVQQKFPDR
jgi:hypothetical protein